MSRAGPWDDRRNHGAHVGGSRNVFERDDPFIGPVPSPRICIPRSNPWDVENGRVLLLRGSIDSCWPGRKRLASFTAISAARWSNACTILPSYSGIHSPFGLPKRLPPMGNARFLLFKFLFRAEQVRVVRHVKHGGILTGHALTSDILRAIHQHRHPLVNRRRQFRIPPRAENGSRAGVRIDAGEVLRR